LNVEPTHFKCTGGTAGARPGIVAWIELQRLVVDRRAVPHDLHRNRIVIDPVGRIGDDEADGNRAIRRLVGYRAQTILDQERNGWNEDVAGVGPFPGSNLDLYRLAAEAGSLKTTLDTRLGGAGRVDSAGIGDARRRSGGIGGETGNGDGSRAGG
jgi:hypothetical protein